MFHSSENVAGHSTIEITRSIPNTSTIILDTLSIEGGGISGARVKSRKIIIFKFNKYTAFTLDQKP